MLKIPRLGRIGKANVGVAIVTFTGIFGFVLAKKQVDSQRYTNMKARQRMLKSNEGDYEVKSRFH